VMIFDMMLSKALPKKELVRKLLYSSRFLRDVFRLMVSESCVPHLEDCDLDVAVLIYGQSIRISKAPETEVFGLPS
jgi:hypothetical protein